MSFPARKYLSRLSTMSWDEVQTRLRQQISKRLDIALCGIGLQPVRNSLRSSSKHTANFFFAPSEIPQRVRLLRKYLPQQVKEIIADADEICSHRFRLLGYPALPYGAEIDWHLDAVHGRRSPLIAWFKIDFLNFEEIGDHKVIWELNRHQHLVTLAKAWLLTGEQRYADEIFAQWYSWQGANPYPFGANWASSLEVAFRSLSWVWTDHLLSGCSRPQGFENDLLHGLALNGRHIQRYLSTYFSPNTHLLGEAVALFFIGTLYPQISSYSEWKQLGWRIIQEAAFRQVRPDGVYFEQTLYYHVYALDFFLHARLLASRNGVRIAPEFDLVIKKMLKVIRALSQAGPPDGFGDDDGGRLFDSSRNRAEHMTDPLPIGAALFQDQSIAAGTSTTEEAIWVLDEAAVLPQNEAQPAAVLQSQTFPDGGLFVMTRSEPFPQQLVIDAGPQGTSHCGHGHADALSLKLSFAGQRWLVDAGTGSYIGPSNERDTFRGTAAHNTLIVDGFDQAQPESPFAWSSIPKTEVQCYVSGPTVSLFAASHSGYERLRPPVRHHRLVFLFEANLFFIRDLARGTDTHTLETSWHFHPDLEVFPSEAGFTARRRFSADNAHSRFLTLLPVDDSRWAARLVSEQVSPAYGQKVNAPVIRCSARLPLPAETAILLIVGNGQQTENDSRRFVREDLSTGSKTPEAVYRLEQAHISHRIVLPAAGTSIWTYGPWSSDSQFLYFRMREDRVDRLFFHRGKFVQFNGKTLMAHSGVLEWLEWSRVDNREQLACSEAAAAASFRGMVLD